MKKCFIVIFSSYSEETSAYAFYQEADARKSVLEDVETELRSLSEEGYQPVIKEIDNHGSMSVYVPDSDIYCEWIIVPSEIQ